MEDVTVRGEVRGADGAPVAGARVSITDSPVPVPEIAAVTGPDGGFVLAAPAPGRYAFAAHADGVPGGPATGEVAVPPPAAGPPSPPVSADPDEDVGSDDAMEAPPSPDATVPGEEVRVVLTFDRPAGGGA